MRAVWELRWARLILCACALAGCSSEGIGPSGVDPSGPPEIEVGLVERHAEQLDEELGDRPAGSQREQVASQYVLGHLQRAGYPVRLEAVPVANLVDSTNLLALPPGGESPTTIVTVAYDAFAGERAGESVGVFLELARALHAADPDHRIEFAALGAERTGPHLGSRRLAQQLRAEGGSPFLVTIAGVGEGRPLSFAGEAAAELRAAAGAELDARAAVADLDVIGGVDVFGRAGFDHLIATGEAGEVGPVLLGWLRSRGD